MRREFILPADESAPLRARSALNGAIPPPVLNGRVDDARVAISELATNAVRHGRPRPDQDALRLVIEADDDHVRVEIEQPTAAVGVRVVEPRLDDPLKVGGYGLLLVEQMADEWGFEPGPPGHVWFEFRR